MYYVTKIGVILMLSIIMQHSVKDSVMNIINMDLEGSEIKELWLW